MHTNNHHKQMDNSSDRRSRILLEPKQTEDPGRRDTLRDIKTIIHASGSLIKRNTRDISLKFHELPILVTPFYQASNQPNSFLLSFNQQAHVVSNQPNYHFFLQYPAQLAHETEKTLAELDDSSGHPSLHHLSKRALNGLGTHASIFRFMINQFDSVGLDISPLLDLINIYQHEIRILTATEIDELLHLIFKCISISAIESNNSNNTDSKTESSDIRILLSGEKKNSHVDSIHRVIIRNTRIRDEARARAHLTEMIDILRQG